MTLIWGKRQHLFCPLHLKGQPPLQSSTSVTDIESTGKRPWSCLPATQKTWIFRHQGIWVGKQTNRQDCYILPLEIKTKQSNWPAWPSCLAAVTLDTEFLLYKTRGKQQEKERNIQHGEGWGRQGGGREETKVYFEIICVHLLVRLAFCFFLWGQEDRPPSCESCWQSKYQSPFLFSAIFVQHFT